LEAVRRTHDFFERGRSAGAFTALQVNLAGLDHVEVRREGRKLEDEVRLARLELNVLLGVPPGTEFALQVDGDPFTARNDVPSATTLTDLAVENRADLQALLAAYEQAEQNLRLAHAQGWPSLSLGTGIGIVLPIFSQFNAPAARTAWEMRERLRKQVEVEVHRLRQEVHHAVMQLEIAAEQAAIFRDEIQPELDENLRLAGEALEMGEVTLIEILTAQRQVLDFHRRHLQARIDHARATIQVAWVAGGPQTIIQP
jgi:cobalt-zinc-cadmium efflux system outer membrane protein